MKAAQLFRLSFADMRADWAIVLCQMAAVAAVLAPLLVLFGLQQGVIGTMIARLNQNPEMLLITLDVTGNHRFDQAWFSKHRERPDVRFLIPATRKIASEADLVPEKGTISRPERVAIIPTGAGDPASGSVSSAVRDQDVALSALAARRLSVAADDRVRMVIERSRDGRIEPATLSLRVAAILAPEFHGGASLFVAPELAQAVEAFRDGFAIPELGWNEGASRIRSDTFVDFRLYARSIRDVASLSGALEAQGLSVSTRGREIASALALEANLTAVLLIVSGLGLLGYLIMLGAGQWSNVERKRRDLAILALVGYGPSWRLGMPVVQGLAVALMGAILAILAFWVVAEIINLYFSASIAQNEKACHLAPSQLLMALLGTGTMSILPALAAGLLMTRLDPSREVRDV
jgi:putative ABC transport system permease protein